MLKNIGIKPLSTINTFKNKQQENLRESKQLLNADMFLKSSSILSFKETVSDANSVSQLPTDMIEIKGNEGKIERLEGQRIYTSHNNNSKTEVGSILANNVRLVGGTFEVGTIKTFDLPELNAPGEVVIIGNHSIQDITATKAKIVNYEAGADHNAVITDVMANNIHLGGNATVVNNVKLTGDNAKLEIDSKPQVKVIDFSEATSATLTLSNKSNTEINHEHAKIVNGKDASDFAATLIEQNFSIKDLSQAFPGYFIKESAGDDCYYAKTSKSDEPKKHKFSPYGLKVSTHTSEPNIIVSSKPVSLSALQEQFGLKIIGTPANITTIFEEPKTLFIDNKPRFKTVMYPVINDITPDTTLDVAKPDSTETV